jgi:hypothetical protein
LQLAGDVLFDARLTAAICRTSPVSIARTRRCARPARVVRSPAMDSRAFRWACLGVAVVAVAVLLWMLNDMRREVKRTNDIVAKNLPEIIANVKVGTETLVNVAKDIEAVRDLAGITGGASDRPMLRYADAILDYLETLPGQIGLEEVVGSDMKDLMSAKDWARDSRKEAIWLTVRADTPAEMLDRIAHNKFGRSWYYVPPGGVPVPLSEQIKANVPSPP